MKVNQVLVTINGKRRFRITADTINKVFDCDYAVNTIEIRVTESISPRSHFKNAIVVFEEEYEDTFNLNHMLFNFKSMIEKLLSYEGREEDVISYAYAYAQDTVNAVVFELAERYKIDNRVNIHTHGSLSDCTATLDTALYLIDAYGESDIVYIRVYAINFITDKEITLFSVENPTNIKQYKELITELYNYGTNTPFRLLDIHYYQTKQQKELLIAVDKDNRVAIETTDNRDYIAFLSASFDTLKSIKIIRTTDKYLLFSRFMVKNEDIWHAFVKTDLIISYLDMDVANVSSLAGVISHIPKTKKLLKRKLYMLLAYINRVDIEFRGSWRGVGLKKVQTCIGLTPSEIDRLYTKYDIVKEVRY